MSVNLFMMGSANTGKSKTYSGIHPSARGSKVARCSAKNKWPDCLTPQFSHLPLIISERVAGTLKREGVAGLSLVEVTATTRSPLGDGRRYFIAEPVAPPPDIAFRLYEQTEEGRLSFILECCDRKNDPRYLEYINNAPVLPRVRRICKQANFSADFMQVPETESGTLGFGVFLCTRRIVELARKEKWTNFSFTPIDSLGSMWGDALDSPWPPELWYPPYQPAD